MLSDLPLGSVLLNGAIRGIEEGRKRERRNWQKWGISDELGRLETVFHRKFAAALLDLAGESDNPDELRSLAHRWEVNSDEDALAMEFDDIKFAFESETVAVNRILAVIQDRVGIESESREDVREAIIEAYRAALEEFLDEINKKDSDLARLFQDRLQMDIHLRVTEALDRLDRLASGPPWRFHRYDPTVSSEIDELVESLWETDPEETAKFVDRPEVHDLPDTKRLLVVGPAGSGKTRVLGELVFDWAEKVSLVLTPKEALQIHGQSEWAFERVEYDGDVLLVWDDIHRVDEQQENRILEDVLPAMGEAVEAYGHDLYVLAAARSGDIGDLPGKGIRTPGDIAERDYGLWGLFQPLELGTMDAERLRTLTTRIADQRSVEFGGKGEDGDAVLDALIGRAADRSAPNYIDAVCRTVDGTLTMADVRDLPETAAGIWRKQYSKLESSDSRSDGDQLALLRACKLLYDLGLRRYPSLLTWGVYQHVIGRGDSRDDFQDAVKGLANRQWMRIEGDDDYGRGVAYRFHDTQLEAIERRLQNWAFEFSDFLNGDELARYTRGETNPDEFELHGSFATILFEAGGHGAEAKSHFETALELTSPTGNLLDSTYSFGHNNYGALLKSEESVRDVGRARAHFEAVLELTSPSGELLDSTYVNGHFNYATLLGTEESVRDAERAKAHFEAALELTSPSGELLDSIDAGVHTNYATLLREGESVRDVGRAKAHLEAALGLTSPSGELLGSTDPNAHNNYANLLFEEESVRDVEGARNHLEASLDLTSPSNELLDSTYANAHYNYANILKGDLSVRDIEMAKNHYEAALELTSPSGELLDSTYTDAHNNYASLLIEEGSVRSLERAKAHFEAALELTSPSGELLDSTDPNAHNNYAKLLATMDLWRRVPHHFTRYLNLSHSVVGVHVPKSMELLLDALERTDTTAEIIDGFYRFSLACTVEFEEWFALLTAEEAWDRRNDLSPGNEVYPTTLAGGVWYAVLCSLVGRDDAGEVAEVVRETVEPHLDRLSPTAKGLYTLRFTDQSAATPSELRKRLDTDDYITALEIDAYERLLSAFGS